MKKILLFILLFISLCYKVQAENVTLVSDRFDDTYVYYYDSNLGRTRYLEASKYSFNGNIAYCLEIGKHISSINYNTSNSFDSINIKKDDLDYIKLISYYGYDYPGHQTDAYYMATQELIWVRLIRTSIKWTNGFNPDSFHLHNLETDEILRLYRNHNKKPSFNGNTIDFVLGKEMVIEDSNNVLEQYDVTSNDAYIDGNKLVLKSGFHDNKIVLKRKIYNNKSFILYSSGISQRMMSVGSIDSDIVSIDVNLTGGSLSIKKYDRDTLSDTPTGEGSLLGAEYELYDSNNNLVTTLITGSKEKVDNLPLGKYYLKEKKASTGYKLDTNTYDVEVTLDNLDTSLTLYEEIIRRDIDLFKVLGTNETGIMTSEEGITFEFYDKDNNLVNSVVTDSDGHAYVNLPYGKYKVHQVNSIEGYYKVEDFYISNYEDNDKPIYKLLSDSEIRAKVKVIKKDIDTNENIVNSNIRFKIYDKNKKEYVSFKVNYPDTQVIREFKVNDKGEFITPDELGPGDYILYEVDDMMDGYLYNEEGVEFSIGENSNLIKEEDDVIIEVPFFNKKVTGKIIIDKYGEDIIYKGDSFYYKEIYLDNVVFDLYADEDIYSNGDLIYNKDELVKNIITDDAGHIEVDNLPLGRYRLKEISSNNDNVVSEEESIIELNYIDQHTKVVEKKLNIYNYLEKGKLTINKYETGTNVGLSNTLIEIKTSDDIVVYKGYTDENGKITIDNLMYGDYYLSEVESTTGYKILDDKIYFSIDKDEVVLDVYNDRLEVPITGLSSSTINILISLGIMVFIFLLCIFFDKIIIRIISIIMIMLGVIYMGFNFNRGYLDDIKNKTAIKDYKDNVINDTYEEKYRYKAILSIPSIGLERGILDIDNEYNSAKYNIEVVDNNMDRIVLASHNGDYYNSYFGKLKDLELGDNIDYYFDNKIYRYIYSESYNIKKTGEADIYTNKDKKAIVLITCMDENDDAQVVRIGYLKEVLPYDNRE